MAKVSDLSRIGFLSKELQDANHFLSDLDNLQFYVHSGNSKYIGTPGHHGTANYKKANDAYRKTAERLVKKYRDEILADLAKLGINP